MDKNLVEKGFWAIVLIMLSPLIVWYFSILDALALWLYAWIIPTGLIVFRRKGELFGKGLFMIGYTVIICAAGSELISKQNPDMAEAVKNFTLMITLIAGGLGGNLMSHDLIASYNANKPNK